MVRFLRAAGMTVGGLTVVGGAGAVVTYRRRLKENKSVVAEDFNASQDQKALQEAFEALKKRGQLSAAELPRVLFYRYTTCPFCGKAKAFLDYHKITHECVEVEPMLKSEIAASPYKKVPQVQFHLHGHKGPYLVDSDLIVETLAPIVGCEKQLKDPDVTKWRDWARASLVKHLVVNLNQSMLDAWGGYNYIDQFDTIPYKNKVFLKVMGAPVMYLVSKYKTMPALIEAGEITETSDRRAVLHDQLERFVTDGLRNGGAGAAPVKGVSPRLFHGGSEPDMADLDIYGVMQSLRGHHIYDDCLRSTRIAPWVMRMDEKLGKPKYDFSDPTRRNTVVVDN